VLKEQTAYRELRAGNVTAWFLLADAFKKRDSARADACRALGELGVKPSDDQLDDQISTWSMPVGDKWFAKAGRYLSAFLAANFVARVSHIATKPEQLLPVAMVRQWLVGACSTEDCKPYVDFAKPRSNALRAFLKASSHAICIITSRTSRIPFNALQSGAGNNVVIAYSTPGTLAQGRKAAEREREWQVALCRQVAVVHNSDLLIRTLLKNAESHRSLLGEYWIQLMERAGIEVTPVVPSKS
jgi:hypothetical protein